jgi:lysophospholipase L1-like esterase
MRKTRFDSLLIVLFVFISLVSASASAILAEQPVSVIPAPKTTEKWQQRQEKINERVKQGNVDMVLIGDSITQGWEGNGKEVWKKFYENRNAANLGISGDQTQHVLWRLENGNIDGISPKLAMIMIGTNNAGAKQTPEDVAAGVTAIVKLLRERLPQTKLLLLAIFPRGADDQDPKREDKRSAHEANVKANQIIANLADNRMIFYMDIGDKFRDSDGKLTKDITYDFLHLTEKGYTIWAEAVEPMVDMLMTERSTDLCSYPERLHPGIRMHCKKHHRAVCLTRTRLARR